MRSHEDASIYPYDGNTIQDNAKGNKDRKPCLIFTNMSENQIFADKSRGDWKAGSTETSHQEYECDSWMPVRMTMELIKVDAAFKEF